MTNDAESTAATELAAMLRNAIMSNQSAHAIELLERPGDHHLLADDDGWTPIHCACSVGDMQVVAKLLNKGAPVDVRDGKNKWSPVHYAAAHGYPDLIAPLAEAGADVNAVSGPQGNTPMHIAAEFGVPDVVEALAKRGAKTDVANHAGEIPLHIAVAKGNRTSADALLAAGADLNARGGQQATALHWATSMGNTQMVQWLIENGAHPDLADELGWTPLFLAAHGNNGELVNLIASAGASTDAVINGKPVSIEIDSAPVSANDQLLAAAHDGRFDGVSEALARGADVNCTTDDGWTPLLAGIENMDITKLLLKNGADPNIATDRGYTALMRAGGKGNLDAVELLISNGADPLLKDCNGKSAYRLTDEMNESDCTTAIADVHAKKLIERYADNERNSESVLIPLEGSSLMMISMTRSTVGGTVRRLDLKFKDGTQLSGARLLDELVVEIPREHAQRDIASISVPFEQS